MNCSLRAMVVIAIVAGAIRTGRAQPAAAAVGAVNPASLPPVMRVKLHTFRDVTMGGVVSHSVVLPEGWTSTGQTEWSGGELSYPQNTFEINSPDGGRIRFIPAMTQTYTEVNPVPGFAPIPPQGVPAPQDFPSFLVMAKSQNPKASNVSLVEGKRQPRIEEMYAKMNRDAGIADNGMQREVYVVTLEYDEAGVRRREDALMLFVRYAPIINQNIRAQTWSIFTTFVVSAPKEKFDGMKPQLYTIAGSVRPTPQWWRQSQALLAELSRIRIEERWRSIRQRGEMINQRFSDDEYARYKKSMSATSDATQRDRINTIYETSDYRDSDGGIVNLPMHYKNVFSDGKGNYVLSNNTQDKPGELWNAIEPMK
jgi:hypothetical protein